MMNIIKQLHEQDYSVTLPHQDKLTFALADKTFDVLRLTPSRYAIECPLHSPHTLYVDEATLHRTIEKLLDGKAFDDMAKTMDAHGQP
jgi:hypothetical protein